MLELGGSLSADLNQDGKYDQADAYGIVGQNDTTLFLFHGFGATTVERNEQGAFTFALDSERMIDRLTKALTIRVDEVVHFNRQTFKLDMADAINMFCENRAAFMIRPLYSLYNMRNMGAEYGILPLPKYNEEQKEYYTSINKYGSTIAMIPIDVADPERSAVVLSVLACESHYLVNDVLYETVLGSKLVRNAESKKSLEYVFDGLLFDSGYLWNFGKIANTILTKSDTDVASMIASIKDVVINEMETVSGTVASFQ